MITAEAEGEALGSLSIAVGVTEPSLISVSLTITVLVCRKKRQCCNSRRGYADGNRRSRGCFVVFKIGAINNGNLIFGFDYLRDPLGY
jgi:hypothetical protein